MENIIEINGLKKSFGSKEVLNGLSLALSRGENLVVLGRSGVGKSVLIKCIIRLIEPDAGEIQIFDNDIMSYSKEELKDIRKKVGFLFQGGALYDALTVEENLAFPLKRNYDQMSRSEMSDKIQEVLNAVGLKEARKKMPSELSGGMNKRIALARTLIMEPEIMLYDEPTTGLDPVTSHEISELILRMQDKYNMSSIIITHDMKCAEITANRLALIRAGKIEISGDPEEIKESDNKWLDKFFKTTN